QEIERDPAKGTAEFRVRTEWMGQMRSRTSVQAYTIGGWQVHRNFTIDADEPFELFGRNTGPNPQEILMAGLNACLTAGCGAAAAMRGITRTRVQVDTSGTLDLRGFLGVNAQVRPWHETVCYTVRLQGAAPPNQFQEPHETVARTSPNYFNITRPVKVLARLVVE